METFSFSRVDCWRRCPQLHKYRYVDKKEAREKALALEFGSLWHDIMYYYYQQIAADNIVQTVWNTEYQQAFREAEAIGSDLEELEEKWNKLYKRLEKGFTNYLRGVERYEYKFLWAEQKLSMMERYTGFTITVTLTGSKNDNPDATYKITGIPDLCVEWNEGIWLVSHKTASQYEPLRYQWNDQDLLYLRLVDLNDMEPRLPLRGIIYHVLDSTKLESHFLPIQCIDTQVQDAVDRFKQDVECIQQDTIHTAHPMWNCHMSCEFNAPCIAERAGYTIDWNDYPQYRERTSRTKDREAQEVEL